MYIRSTPPSRMPDTTRIGVDPRYKKMYIPRKYYIPGSPSPANPFSLVKPNRQTLSRWNPVKKAQAFSWFLGDFFKVIGATDSNPMGFITMKKPTLRMFPKIMGFPPKSSILIGFSIINLPFWKKTTSFWNHHLDSGICLVIFSNQLNLSKSKTWFQDLSSRRTNRSACFQPNDWDSPKTSTLDVDVFLRIIWGFPKMLVPNNHGFYY